MREVQALPSTHTSASARLLRASSGAADAEKIAWFEKKMNAIGAPFGTAMAANGTGGRFVFHKISVTVARQSEKETDSGDSATAVL